MATILSLYRFSRNPLSKSCLLPSVAIKNEKNDSSIVDRSIVRSIDRSIDRTKKPIFKFQISIGQGWGTAVPLRPSEPSRPSPGQLKFEICVRAIDRPIDRSNDRSIDDRRFVFLSFSATDGNSFQGLTQLGMVKIWMSTLFGALVKPAVRYVHKSNA